MQLTFMKRVQMMIWEGRTTQFRLISECFFQALFKNVKYLLYHPTQRRIREGSLVPRTMYKHCICRSKRHVLRSVTRLIAAILPNGQCSSTRRTCVECTPSSTRIHMRISTMARCSRHMPSSIRSVRCHCTAPNSIETGPADSTTRRVPV